MSNFKIGFLITLGVVFILGIITFFSSYRVIDVTEFAYKYDLLSGEVEGYWEKDSNGEFVLDENGDRIPETGFVWKTPFFEKVHTIETLPYRVCLGEENTRVLNCKLVQFNPNGWRQFIMWHGRRDYDHNRYTNSGNSDYDLNKILMAYAYAENPSQYDFLELIEDSDGSVATNDTVQ